MLQKNQVLPLEIEDLNNLGYGVAHAEGQTVFVSGGVVGDLAEVRILKVEKTWAAGKVEALLRPSAVRIPNDCAAKGCGGCAYREITYEEECRRKQNYVDFCFRKAGVQAEVLPVVTASGTEHYRNKAQYAIGQDREGQIYAGFYAPKSHRVVKAEGCPLQPKVFADTVAAALDFFNRGGFTVYDEKTGKGLLRHLYLRYSEKEEKLLFTVVASGTVLPEEGAFVSHMRAAVPSLAGILLNENTRNTNVVLGDTYRTLWGAETLVDTLCGVSLEISPAAFFQVNRPAAEALYEKGKELAGLTGKEVLWDLYCGAGSIGLSMADSCREVVGVEIVPQAVENAKENALRNGIRHARFVLGDAGTPETLLANAYGASQMPPDVVVVDPPRKGCTPELLIYLAETVKVQRIVYISCAPDTLARDAALLLAHGYTMSAVTPVNLFPRTGHVETIVCLRKQ